MAPRSISSQLLSVAVASAMGRGSCGGSARSACLSSIVRILCAGARANLASCPWRSVANPLRGGCSRWRLAHCWLAERAAGQARSRPWRSSSQPPLSGPWLRRRRLPALPWPPSRAETKGLPPPANFSAKGDSMLRRRCTEHWRRLLAAQCVSRRWSGVRSRATATATARGRCARYPRPRLPVPQARRRVLPRATCWACGSRRLTDSTKQLRH